MPDKSPASIHEPIADIVFDPLKFSRKVTSPGEDRDQDWDAGKVANGYTCKKSAKHGDLYLFWFAEPYHGVYELGVCDGNVRTKDESNWPFWPEWPEGWVCGYDPFLRLENEVRLLDHVQTDPVLSNWWRGLPARGGPKTLLKNPIVARRILELILRLNPDLTALLGPYLVGLPAPSMPSGPIRLPEEDEGPPSRVVYTVTRIVRNTALGDELKNLYNYQCQVCGQRIDTPTGPYIEVHHLRPLGGEHAGPDSWDNMLVLCPNCHAEFDGLAIAICPQTDLIACFDEGNELEDCTPVFWPEHLLAKENIEYHWWRFCHAKGLANVQGQ
jgi:hypothetical protein